jgi:hypothetical protein
MQVLQSLSNLYVNNKKKGEAPMSNKSRPMTNTEFDEVEDINVIAYFPKELSDEMVVLVRRIAYLKTKLMNVNESQLEVMGDVSDFEDFITNLFLSKRTTIGEYFMMTDPYHPYLHKEPEEPDYFRFDDDGDKDEELQEKIEKIKRRKKSK